MVRRMQNASAVVIWPQWPTESSMAASFQVPPPFGLVMQTWL